MKPLPRDPKGAARFNQASPHLARSSALYKGHERLAARSTNVNRYGPSATRRRLVDRILAANMCSEYDRQTALVA
jgi:hypothetical protein